MDRRPHARRHRHTSLLTAIVLIIGIVAGCAATASAQDPPTRLQASALQQIAAAQAEKASRSQALQKVDSRLALEVRRASDSELARSLDRALPHLRRAELTRRGNRVLVDLRAAVDHELLARIGQLGGEIVSAHERFGAARVWIPLGQVETLAAEPGLRWIRPADEHMTQMTDTTEGDVAHGADTARTNFGVDGTGVTACAMSDSVESLAALQGTGDLPAGVTVLPGQAGTGTSEGTALLEILHDLAPGADLAFATGQGGQAQMAQNILDLRDIGCDVIVDDILYFAEGVFQDGVIAQAVDEVSGDGVTYFSSAGNSGNLNAGTSGVFEGDYSAGPLPGVLTGVGDSAHDFDGGDVGNEVTSDSPFFFTLQWADPLGGATNDYDLYLLDNTLANVIGASTSPQSGTQDPFEAIDSQAFDDTGNQLVVVRNTGSASRFFHLNVHRGELEYGTDGQIFGHPAAEGALTVAAVNVATAGGGVFTGGAANPVETFTSDGPRRIFFAPNGDPVAALAFRPGGGLLPRGVPSSVVRQKPDVAAADGVSTATPGFNPFFGTSASAPHAAGIAALFEDLFPSVSVPDIFDAFRSSALDIDPLGFDRDSGFGIVQAENVLSPPNMIFVDGFESGNTSAWTNP